MKRRVAACVLLFVTSHLLAQNDYSYLDDLEGQNTALECEEAPPSFRPGPPLKENLSSYYEEFRKDKKVRVYLGYGKDGFSSNRASQLYAMLKKLSQENGKPLSNFTLQGNRSVGFAHIKDGVQYEVTIGGERNEFMNAFGDHEIVMYHGHSRHGRGPAFGTYSNYYRMGNVFPTIEVDTRNPYFQNEPMQLSETYPPLAVELENKQYSYQYRGEKLESSKLDPDAYTKLIPGMDEDLKKTSFYSGKQLVYLYSCSNEPYWKTPLRKKFTSSQDRFFFGTKEVGYWGSKPEAVFLFDVATGVKDSEKIVKDLNATHDCNSCFTSY